VTDLSNIVALPEEIPSCFLDWNSAKAAGFFTRTTLKYDFGRSILPGQSALTCFQQVELMTPQEWKTFSKFMRKQRQELSTRPDELDMFEARLRRLRWSLRPDNRIELVLREIPLYHLSQSQPGNFRERTKAIIEFARRFWRPSQAANYIQRNLEPDRFAGKWFTKDIAGRGSPLESFHFFDERKLLAHLNQREIFGVKANPSKSQWWCAVDLDLHIEKGGNAAIFLKQVEAVLASVQGGRWIVCLNRERVDGVHLLKFFDAPVSLDEARSFARTMLNQAADANPDLEKEAKAADMKPLQAAEVFPSVSQGFRLPLGIGYTALLDRPLELIQYHTYRGVPLLGADVQSFMSWNGGEMPLAEKLKFIRDRLPGQSVKISTKRATATCDRKATQAVNQDLQDKKLLGTMRGRFRKVLVEFYSGRMQVPGSLQTGILLGANALWAQDFPLDDRADYLLDRISQITVTEPAFSSRLINAEWDDLLDDISHVVETNERLRAEPEKNPKIEESNRILKNWAKSMKKAGFYFGDPATWTRCWSGTESASTWFTADDLTEEDRVVIATRIAPIMVCPENTAVEAVVKMVALVAMKDRQGHGMSREYRRALLTDLGISCQENSKLARCWDVVEEAGFIYTKHGHVFTPERDGRARAYAVGRRVAERIHREQLEKAKLPDWLHDAVDDHFNTKWPDEVGSSRSMSLSPFSF
jgi:hypothetical protein